MKKTYITQISLIAAAILFFLPVDNAYCIPAFARKYQISCQVCHSPVMPRLKAFGSEFAGNGFRMTEYEAPRYFVPVGDDKLSLFRELPLALRMDGFASYNFGNEGTADFASPFVLKILSGGELSDKLSYYFYFLLNERGSIAGVEDAFIMYHDLMNSGVNFYIGQFQVSDPLFKGELRYTLEPYKIYDASPGNSVANLKYDRGIILDKEFKSGTTIVAEVLNGSGLGEAYDWYLFDSDKYKNVMVRLNQSLGKSVSLGVFGYSGKELLSDPGMVFSSITNKIQMIGPDISIDINEKLIINAQYVIRSDSRVFPVMGGMPLENVNTKGGFAEVIYSPKGDNSKWYLTGLFNWIESDDNDLDYQSATLHAGYLLRRNVRVVTEYTYMINPGSFGKLSAGFVSAF